MRTPLILLAIGVIVLSSGGSMAGDVSSLRLASLSDTLATPAVHYFSPKIELAAQSCSTTCNGTSYSNSCSGDKSDCSCNKQPVCECR